MHDDLLIKATSVSKKYCRTLRHTMAYGVCDLAKSFFGARQNSMQLREGEFWAVDNVSFELKRGECLGIIGPNGSGKSTLLKMINGIFMPDNGEVSVRGRIGALIEVGAGFHPMLTGRENVYVNGAILGMSKDDIGRQLDSIVDFSGIEEFIDSPVKHYSSGMFVRLGFAVAAHLRPELLLIDEVLAVGDLQFQIKCFNHIRGLLNDGTSVVLVSHNLYQIQRVCKHSMLIEGGKQSMHDSSDVVASIYEEKYGMSEGASSSPQNSDVFSFDSLEISPASRHGQPGHEYHSAVTDERLQLTVGYSLSEDVHGGVQIGFLIKTPEGQRVFGGTTNYVTSAFPGEKGTYKVCFDFPEILLLQGNYQLSFSAFDGAYQMQLGAWDPAARIRMSTDGYNGLHAIGTTAIPYQAYLV